MKIIQSTVGISVLFATLFVAQSLHAQTNDPQGAVFAATNGADQNEIVMYSRGAHGHLKLVGRFSTGGRGQGGVNDPLQSQSSITVTSDHNYLLAVNAGTSDISVFRITPSGLSLLSVTPSGGGNPVSVAVYEDLIYVLNFGGNYHTAGFRLASWGGLMPVANSKQTFASLDPGVSTLAFTPDGSKLIVTERLTNKIDVFTVNSNGSISNPVSNNSAGVEPFGIQFNSNGTLLVSETEGGPPNDGTVSSYLVNADNTLTVVSPKADAGGQATCWVATSGTYAYGSNTATSTIGGFQLAANGSLTPLGVVAQEPPPANVATSFPLDLSFSSDGKFLYVFYSGLGEIIGYQVGDGGKLSKITSVNPEMPSIGAEGLAAY